MLCKQCGAETPKFLRYCAKCGRTPTPSPIIESADVKQQTPEWRLGDPNDTMRSTPVKWHNFLSCFGLYLVAFLLFALAMLSISGFIYGIGAEKLYRDYPSLGTADTTYGLLLLCGTVLAVLSASALRHSRKTGLRLLTLLYLFLLITSVGYFLWSLYLTNTGMVAKLFPQSAAVFGASMLSLIPNWIYYRKREHIFIFD